MIGSAEAKDTAECERGVLVRSDNRASFAALPQDATVWEETKVKKGGFKLSKQVSVK